MRFSSANKPQGTESGFTLIEMLIIAPIVMLAIGGFIALMVSMVGTVLISRDRNAISYNVQDALDRIEQDTRISTQYLVTTNTVASPQGSNDSTAAFTNASALILSSLTTNMNPADPDRQLIYYANQPNNCGTQETYNRVFLTKIVYFVKNGSLWRRVILPPYNTNATPDANTVCKTPWQRNSCTPGYTASPPCETRDSEIMQNVDSFSVKYYADPASTTALSNSAAKTASTIEVTINGKKTTAGKTLDASGTVRATKLNSVESDLLPPGTPAVSYTLSGPASAQFSWNAVATATSYQISYSINGGAVTTTSTNSSTTNFTVNANRNDTVTFKVAAKNATGVSPDSVTTVTMPAWTACDLQNGWANYGSGYPDASFTRTSAGVVMLNGLIRYGTANQWETICTLPVGYRPDYNIIFQVSTNGTTVGRVDIYPNGNVVYVTGSSGWLNLSTISFLPSGSYSWSSGLTGANGWVYYGGSYSPIKVATDSLGRKHIEGLAKGGTTTNGTNAFALPGGFTPSTGDIYGASSGQFNAAQTWSDAYIKTRGIPYNGYWSLQFMWWPGAGPWTAGTLQNGWVAYGGTYSTAGYTKAADGIVNLHGLIKSGTTPSGTVIMNLPAGYRPKNNIICDTVTYDATNASGYARIDILPNGNVVTREGVLNNWLSLAGCDFIAEQ